MPLIEPGRLLPRNTLQSRQKSARGRDELIYSLDESLQPGVLLFHLAGKRILIRAVGGAHVTHSGRPANPRLSPSRHRIENLAVASEFRGRTDFFLIPSKALGCR